MNFSAENMILIKSAEDKNRTLLVIDVQPEMDAHVSFYDHCALAKAMSEYPRVIYVVDENMAGGELTEPDVHPQVREYLNSDAAAEMLEERGYSSIEEAEEAEDWDLLDELHYCPLAPHIDLKIKAYGGPLRSAMDLGLEDEAIEFFTDMVSGTALDVLVEKYEDFLEDFNQEYGRSDSYELADEMYGIQTELVRGIPNEFFTQMGPFDIAGGHRSACVREVTMALEVLSVDYNLIEPLIYDKQRSSIDVNQYQ